MQFFTWTAIVGTLFLLTLSVSAGTFLETFDNFNLKDWEEVTERNSRDGEWRIVDGVLHAESKDDAIRMLAIKDAAWHDYEIETGKQTISDVGSNQVGAARKIRR